MATWREIVRIHRANPTWTAKQIAKELGCLPEQVHVCKQRHGLKIPRDTNRNYRTDSVFALGREARRAGLTIEALQRIGRERMSA